MDGGRRQRRERGVGQVDADEGREPGARDVAEAEHDHARRHGRVVEPGPAVVEGHTAAKKRVRFVVERLPLALIDIGRVGLSAKTVQADEEVVV